MQSAPVSAVTSLSADEAQRFDIVQALALAGVPGDPAIDTVARAARRLSGCAISLVTLLQAEQALHVACDGAELDRSPREHAFCSHAIANNRFFEVADLSTDARFADNPHVVGPAGLRHYAAMPIEIDGVLIGTLCVLDPKPGRLPDDVRSLLVDLAGVVTELLRQRQQRREVEVQAERMRDLARASGDWAWELDADLRCRWIAGDFEAVTGLSPDHALGQVLADEPLVDANGHDRLPAAGLLSVLRSRRTFSRVISRFRGRDASLLVSRSALAVFDANGQFKGYRGTARDVTARIERESLLRDKAALESASRAKSEFLSRVSHELRTPLNAILGFAQLMVLDREQPLAPQQAYRIDGVQRAGKQLLDMVNDVLDIVRIEQGTQPLQPHPVDIGALVRACSATMQPLAATQPVTVGVDVSPGLMVLADERALEQVLVNLMSNAIKFNRPHGRVDIVARAQGQCVQLEVVDTGQGLGADELAQLFQPFNRLGAERRRIEGSGLGLVIVRELARAMRAELHVSSEPGFGSVFRIDLPVAGAAAPADAPATAEPILVNAAPAIPRQVLYIEDEPLNIVLMQEIFKARPTWTLHVACEGVAGVDAARRLRPDLVLVDMNLPDINGLEVLRRLRGDPHTSDLRCIALSADAMVEQIAAARSAGFDDYWTKPIDLAHLLESVGRAIEPPAPR